MKERPKKIAAAGLVVFMLAMSTAGCAQRSKNIQASYVSPLQFQHYNCSQIGQEISRVNRKVMEVSGAQDSAATKDAVAMGVGMVIFWPALFFMIGGDRKDELAKLKGEYDALESMAVEKECSTVLEKLEEGRKKQEVLEKKKEEQGGAEGTL